MAGFVILAFGDDSAGPAELYELPEGFARDVDCSDLASSALNLLISRSFYLLSEASFFKDWAFFFLSTFYFVFSESAAVAEIFNLKRRDEDKKLTCSLCISKGQGQLPHHLMGDSHGGRT